MNYVFRDYQNESVAAGVAAITAKKNGIIVAPTGCHARGTKILLATGQNKYVEDIQVGDNLMGPDGKPRKVLSLCRGQQMMYRISPIRGAEPFIVNADHILHLVCTREGKLYNASKKGGEVDHISVRDYLVKSKSWKHLRKLQFASCLKLSHRKTLPISAWILGAILGDGHISHGTVSITSDDPEIIAAVRRYARLQGLNSWLQSKTGTHAVNIRIVKQSNKYNRMYANPLMEKLQSLGLAGKKSGDKFIPDIYKYSNPQTRLEILAGLLDTDGSLGGKGYDFISKSKLLAADVSFIARSLGFSVTNNECVKSCQNGHSGTYYRVSINGNTDRIPCRIMRKKSQPRLQKKDWLRTGFSIEPIGEDDFYGFSINGDHLYLTSDFIIHHNSGKSLIIAGIAKELNARCVVLQPSKEILEQNYEKMQNFGFWNIGVFSASCGRKDTGQITFATIGSIISHKERFENCDFVIVDECHGVNSKGGMYETFLNHLDLPTLGLTATPYRLRSYNDNATGQQVAESRILTRTRPRIFNKISHITQVKALFEQGYLCPLDYDCYTDYNVADIESNSTGQGFDESALERYNKTKKIPERIGTAVATLSGIKKHVLAFTHFRSESREVLQQLRAANISAAEISGESTKQEREDVLKAFKCGVIKCVVNVGVLTTGFDFPQLDCVILGRPTKSVALYYQMVGRGVRPAPGKESCSLIDLCDNVNRFGKIETFEIYDSNGNGLWRLRSDKGNLTGTDVTTGRELEGQKFGFTQEVETGFDDVIVTFGKFKDKPISQVPAHYLRWVAENLKNPKWKRIFNKELQRRMRKAV